MIKLRNSKCKGNCATSSIDNHKLCIMCGFDTDTLFKPPQVVRAPQHWITPPPECNGNCNLKENSACEYCTTCGWNDMGYS